MRLPAIRSLHVVGCWPPRELDLDRWWGYGGQGHTIEGTAQTVTIGLS